MKDPSSSTPESERSSSKMKTKMLELNEEPKSNEKENNDKSNDQSKFKKVEMSMFYDKTQTLSCSMPIDTFRFIS